MALVKNNPSILFLDKDINRRNIQSSRLRVAADVEVELSKDGFHSLHLLEKTSYSMLIVFEDPADMTAEEMINMVRVSLGREKFPIIYFTKSDQELEKLGDPQSIVNEVMPLAQNYNFSQLLSVVQKYLKPNK